MGKIAKVLQRIIAISVASIMFISMCPVAQAEENTILLDAKETAKIALENNFDIQIYRLDKLIGEDELLSSRAVYDTELSGSYEYTQDRLARTSTLAGSSITTVDQDITLKKKLPTGTVLSLGASHAREYTDSAFATLNPYHESTASASVTQPLLKDFLGIQTRNTIKLAMLDKDNVAYTSTEKIEREIAQAQKAYWRLVLAYHEFGLRDQVLSSAKRLYEVTAKNFELGIVEKAEFFAIEANLKERQRDLVLAKNTLDACVNDLGFRLNLPKDINIISKDEPEIIDCNFDFNKRLAAALANRQDYKVAKNEVKSKNLTVAMRRDSLWPQIDLVASLEKNGIDSSFTRSVNEITSMGSPKYEIGVAVSFSLENTQERAEFSQAKLKKVQALLNLKKTECALFIQVNDAVNYAEATKSAAKYQQEATKLQESKYKAEKDRFNKGRSDIDRLIRYQQDYLTSEVAYLNSIYHYNEAMIDLKVTTAELLNEVTL